MFFRVAVLLLCGFFPGWLRAAPATVLVLKNGDRISGEVLREANGTVVLRTEMLGEIAVPRAQIVREEAKPPPSAPVAASPVPPSPVPAPASAAAPPPKAVVPVVAASAPAKPAAAPAAVATPKKKTWRDVLRETKGSAEVSFNDQVGRHSSQFLSLRGDADYTAGDDRYHLDGRYFYGKYDGYLHTDRRDANFRWRHDLTKQIFFQAATGHTVDHVKLIDFNLEQSAGLGWALVANKKQDFNVVAGATTQYRRAFGLDDSTTVLADLSEQYTFRLNERLTLRHDAGAQYSPVGRTGYVVLNGQLIPSNDEAANYRLRCNFALQGKLTNRLTMTLRYEYEYDNVIQAANLKADQRTSSALGYSF